MRTILLATITLFLALPVMAQEAGWIGVSIEDQKDRGAIVRHVEPNSPADKAGLHEGDVILEFNKEEVVGVQQLTRLVRETPVGRTIDVKVRRDNREETVKVTTERRAGFLTFPQGQFQLATPDLRVFSDRIVRDFPRIQMSTVFVQSGIRVEDLTDQLRDFFGVFSNGGVLVTSVDSGSPADKAGLKAGDVITAVDAKTIRNASDFSREMRADSKPTLKVIRDKKERDVKFE
jgi:serine protease Do